VHAKNTIIFVALLFVGCAHASPQNGPPVYWTESGAGSYSEVGRVSGTAFGYCLSGDGIYWSGVGKALRQAKAMGADGILMPNSMANGATYRRNFRCHWILQFIALPGCWGQSVDALAIKLNGSRETALNDTRVRELRNAGSLILVDEQPAR